MKGLIGMADSLADEDGFSRFMEVVDTLRAIRSTVDQGRLDRGAGLLELEHGGVTAFEHTECHFRTIKSYGFISEGEDPYAVYFARWAEGDKSLGVSFLVSIYGYGEEADESARRLAALHCHLLENGPGFEVRNGPDNQWGDISGLGSVVTREEALEQPLAQNVFDIVDKVIVDDPAVREFIYEYDSLNRAARRAASS